MSGINDPILGYPPARALCGFFGIGAFNQAPNRERISVLDSDFGGSFPSRNNGDFCSTGSTQRNGISTGAYLRLNAEVDEPGTVHLWNDVQVDANWLILDLTDFKRFTLFIVCKFRNWIIFTKINGSLADGPL